MGEIIKVVGVCEMETDIWCCGNIGTLTETEIQPNRNSAHTEYRQLCAECREQYNKEGK